MDTSATIIAIASPPGRSTRGIIRLSGDAVPDVLDRLCAAPPSRRGIHTTRIQLDRDRTLAALLLRFPAPRSYTGEHAAELLLPGNPVLLQRVVDHTIQLARRFALDVRAAEPGEFTARAFINCQLTLTQAEGVAATIAARSDAELRAAALLRDDSIGRLAADAADQLASALALLEAGIDFTDEQDVIAIAAADLRSRLGALDQRLAEQLDRAVGFARFDAIPRVVLSGPPNAGKSTLFNALLGRRRAVVSDMAGTTRDVLSEPLHLPTAHGDVEVMLIDIAGIEDATSALISQHMQHVADAARRTADLLLRCVGPSDKAPSTAAADELIVYTMADRMPNNALREPDAVVVCALTGVGLDALRRAIADRLADRAASFAADAVALLPRHEAALRDARDALRESLALLDRSDDRHVADPELVAAAMRHALDQLGRVAGRVTPDDVLGRIFAEFCIGK